MAERGIIRKVKISDIICGAPIARQGKAGHRLGEAWQSLATESTSLGKAVRLPVMATSALLGVASFANAASLRDRKRRTKGTESTSSRSEQRQGFA